eukprot:Nk52_evm1s1314 gene=Nk52_evmTU1s1314
MKSNFSNRQKNKTRLGISFLLLSLFLILPFLLQSTVDPVHAVTSKRNPSPIQPTKTNEESVKTTPESKTLGNNPKNQVKHEKEKAKDATEKMISRRKSTDVGIFYILQWFYDTRQLIGQLVTCWAFKQYILFINKFGDESIAPEDDKQKKKSKRKTETVKEMMLRRFSEASLLVSQSFNGYAQTLGVGTKAKPHLSKELRRGMVAVAGISAGDPMKTRVLVSKEEEDNNDDVKNNKETAKNTKKEELEADKKEKSKSGWEMVPIPKMLKAPARVTRLAEVISVFEGVFKPDFKLEEDISALISDTEKRKSRLWMRGSTTDQQLLVADTKEQVKRYMGQITARKKKADAQLSTQMEKALFFPQDDYTFMSIEMTDKAAGNKKKEKKGNGDNNRFPPFLGNPSKEDSVGRSYAKVLEEIDASEEAERTKRLHKEIETIIPHVVRAIVATEMDVFWTTLYYIFGHDASANPDENPLLKFNDPEFTQVELDKATKVDDVDKLLVHAHAVHKKLSEPGFLSKEGFYPPDQSSLNAPLAKDGSAAEGWGLDQTCTDKTLVGMRAPGKGKKKKSANDDRTAFVRFNTIRMDSISMEEKYFATLIFKATETFGHKHAKKALKDAKLPPIGLAEVLSELWASFPTISVRGKAGRGGVENGTKAEVKRRFKEALMEGKQIGNGMIAKEQTQSASKTKE